VYCSFIWLHCASSVSEYWNCIRTEMIHFKNDLVSVLYSRYCHSHGFSHECTVVYPNRLLTLALILHICFCLDYINMFSCNFTVMAPTLTVQEKSLLLRLSRSVDWEVLEKQCSSKPYFCMTNKWSWSMLSSETKTILYGLCYAFLFQWICILIIDLHNKWSEQILKQNIQLTNQFFL